ncbi:RES family NAD+ phosphorylase [Paenisporosarcina sp. TG-14]|uniref:RES family NAD+ phosphorylase n=1 Tax=Paenisporosarcina sp. TG-14 TaxID=1231057 RepID=UPI0002DDFD79|nr:RES family NAD+ phosphorylase [Paenisporosarcina sp. TG-14]
MNFERCSCCLDLQSIIEFYDSHKLGQIPMSLEISETFTTECPYCNEQLEEGDIIISEGNTFLELVGQEIGEVLSTEIAECQDCNVDKIIYEQRYGDMESLNTVFELLDGWQFGNEVKTFVSGNIRCSKCNEVLAEDIPYVTAGELASWYGEYDEIFDQVFGISSQDGEEFIEYLAQYPMLGLNHPTGQEIFNMIKESTVTGIELLQPKLKFLRGRTRKKLERLVPYIPEELWNPPVEVSTQGRYNPAGVSVLYLAEVEEVVTKEIAFNGEKNNLDIAEFQVEKPLKILNLSDTNSSGFSQMYTDEDSEVKKKYLFPNFIMQCLMLNDFQGIIYDSVKEDGINLCLFNFEKDKDISISNIYTYK